MLLKDVFSLQFHKYSEEDELFTDPKASKNCTGITAFLSFFLNIVLLFS